MSTSTNQNPSFQYLRSKLREWQAADLLWPGEQSRRQFRTVAPVSLLPLVQDLHQALEGEGLRATVREASQDLGVLSLTIDDLDIEVSFAPCDMPEAFRLSTCRMGSQEADVIRLLAYRDLTTDVAGVMGVIEDAVLCALGPRRATTADAVGEPPVDLRS